MTERVQQVVSSMSYVVSGTTAAAGVMTLNEWALAIGIVGTIITVVGNLVYKHLHYKLAKNERERTD